MSEELIRFFMWIAFVVLGVSAGILVMSAVLGRVRKKEEWRTFDEHRSVDMSRGKYLPMFCRDCGKGLISLRTMDGYDDRTGKPIYVYSRACADAGGPTGAHMSDWPYCGVRTKESAIPHAHNHDAVYLSITCPVCLDDMVENGALTTLAAQELYGKAGVIRAQSRRDSEDVDPPYWPSSMGSLLSGRGYKGGST